MNTWRETGGGEFSHDRDNSHAVHRSGAGNPTGKSLYLSEPRGRRGRIVPQCEQVLDDAGGPAPGADRPKGSARNSPETDRPVSTHVSFASSSKRDKLASCPPTRRLVDQDELSTARAMTRACSGEALAASPSILARRFGFTIAAEGGVSGKGWLGGW